MKSFVGNTILSILFLLTLGCGTSDIGLNEKGLRPCPAKPNCVTSRGGDQTHTIAPIFYRSDRDLARLKMKTIVSEMDGSRVITDRADYLHVEFRSRIMKFVDDLEFWFPEGTNLIHIRSAARVGYSDFGVNRERVESIRILYGNK